MSLTLKAALAILAISSMMLAVRENPGDLTPEKTKAIEKAVLESHSKMNEAASKMDIDGMFEWILDSGKGCIVRNGKLMTKRAALISTKMACKGIKSSTYQYDKIYVNVLSQKTALLTAQGVTKADIQNGDVVISPFALTELFVLKEGKWKMLHAHHSIPVQRR